MENLVILINVLNSTLSMETGPQRWAMGQGQKSGLQFWNQMVRLF